MKKAIIGLLVVAASVGLYFSFTSYISKKKENTLQRQVVKPILSDKLPEGFDSVYVERMSELGMNTTKEAMLLLNVKQRKYWKENFGLTFMGDNEMTEFLAENKFILGEANRYLHMIPVEVGNVMIDNINKINPPDKKMYRFWETAGSTWILNEEDVNVHPTVGRNIDFAYYDNEQTYRMIKQSIREKYSLPNNLHCHIMLEPTKKSEIYIIGSAKEFNTTGMVIEDGILKAIPPKDPIAVLKVPNGYVELASWE